MKKQTQPSLLIGLVGQRAVIEFSNKTLSSRIKAYDGRFILLTDNWTLWARKNSLGIQLADIDFSRDKRTNPQLYSLFIKTLLNPVSENVHEYNELCKKMYMRYSSEDSFISVPNILTKSDIEFFPISDIIRPVRTIEQIYTGEEVK